MAILKEKEKLKLLHGDFYQGQESASYIEQVWSQLKSIIKNLYYSIPNSHFILSL
jgi:hypothetical protein